MAHTTTPTLYTRQGYLCHPIILSAKCYYIQNIAACLVTVAEHDVLQVWATLQVTCAYIRYGMASLTGNVPTEEKGRGRGNSGHIGTCHLLHSHAHTHTFTHKHKHNHHQSNSCDSPHKHLYSLQFRTVSPNLAHHLISDCIVSVQHQFSLTR